MGWPNEEEAALGAEVRRLLERSAPREELRTVDIGARHDLAWKALATQLGAAGLAAPESAGGAGADAGAIAVVAEQIGRACAGVPFLSVTLAVTALTLAGDTETLPGVAAGELTATLAAPLDGSVVSVRAEADGAGWRLDGDLPGVLDAAAADLLLVAATCGDGIGLFAVPASADGVRREPLHVLDLGRPQARVELRSTPATPIVADASSVLRGVRQTARLLVAAEQLGVADWAIGTAIEYAKTREQFGVKIGSFQAVKHLCAELFAQTEYARALLTSAVDSCRGKVSAEGRVALNAAAIAATEVAVAATQGAVQVLGGIGFTWEHDAHLYFRRARANAVLAGTPAESKQSLAEILLAGRGLADPEPAMSAGARDFGERSRAFFAEHGGTGHKTGTIDKHVAAGRAFRAKLDDAGLAGITVPTEYGGAGLTIEHDTAAALASRGFDTYHDVTGIGTGMCVPVLLTLGTEEQKRRYIPPLLRGEEVWCQLFSEPGAGSDLAALRTKAVRDGSGDDADWLISGQKVWTTYAHHADYAILLARTDPEAPKHKGITMFALDMKSSGVTPRPLRQMTGDSEFNEVFLDEVRVPANAVIGEVNGGWAAALVMLMNERVTIGRDPLSMSPPAHFRTLRELVLSRGLAEDVLTRAALAEIFVFERGLVLLGNRIAESLRPDQDPGPYASLSKLGAAQLARRTADVAFTIAGPSAAVWAPEEPNPWAYSVLFAPALGIAGGTDQIQKTIIGERVLGLPKG